MVGTLDDWIQSDQRSGTAVILDARVVSCTGEARLETLEEACVMDRHATGIFTPVRGPLGQGGAGPPFLCSRRCDVFRNNPSVA